MKTTTGKFPEFFTVRILNWNIGEIIQNQTTTFTIEADYTQSGNNVTIKKEYLETQGVGPTSLTFNFSAGNMQTLAITVSDTTPQNSTIAPTTATFDKNTANGTTAHRESV